MIKNSVIKYIVISIIIAAWGLFVLRSCYVQNKSIDDIKSNPEFTIGVITSYGLSGKSSKSIDYSFSINNKHYYNSISPKENLKCEIGGYNNCVGKKYVVIYSKRNPENNYLLAGKYEYELFHQPIPKKFEIKE